MKIFISYRRADSKYVVDRIRDRLIVAYGAESVFRDIESIPLGRNFGEVLNSEINGCDVMLVIIGPQWAGITDAEGNKRLFDPADFTRIEIETGLKRDEILVIPVLVMNASMPTAQDLPEGLTSLAYRNATSVRNDPDFDNDINRLILGINKVKGGNVKKIAIEYFEPETVFIPQGPFWMGRAPEAGASNHESPRHEINLSDYRIGKYPVTNAQYEIFISQQKQKKLVPQSMGWDGQRPQNGKENCPVSGVTWYDALDYCKWLSEKTRQERVYSLPNEAHWEKACRAGNDVFFPWGDEFEPTRCNHGQAAIAPVKQYIAQNEFGCHDLVGNVLQWTCTLWGEKLIKPDQQYEYPWEDDQRNDLNAHSQIRRVVRGSSFQDDVRSLRCSARSGRLPTDGGSTGTGYGFRVVMLVERA